MALLITESEVTRLLDMPAAISTVEAALGDQAEGVAANRPRQRIAMPHSQLHVMAAGDHRLGVYGLKTYSVSKEGARFLVLLYDSHNGDLLAFIEADRLGQMRTGAASGVATKYLARQDASSVGIFGTGWQAESQLMAAAAVRTIRSIAVYSRDEAHRKEFASKMSTLLKIDVIPAETPELTVKGRDIVITATTAREPLFDGAWIENGAHVNAVGSNYLYKREIDLKTVNRAALVAVDSLEQSRLEAGDLLPAIERGSLNWESVVELGQVVAGRVPGRRDGEQITLFKSSGIALEDMAVALKVYNLARKQGAGREVDLWSEE